MGREFRTNLEEPVMLAALLGGGLIIFSIWQNIETVVLLIVLFERTVRRIVRLQRDYQTVVQAEHALKSVRDTKAEAEAARDGDESLRTPAFTRRLAFEGVSFAYADRLILDRVSFAIEANSLVVLTGVSGAGKTTLVDLLVGLLRPHSGRFLIDDQPLDAIGGADWRRQIGYMPQDPLLFHDSVLVNLTLGDPALGAAEAEAALRAAEAWDFISALPQGIETNVGERGAQLSGGERQRIALARALIRKPRLLILDEATSALDPATEANICDTLRRLTEQVTILAIAHHSGLIARADAVFALEAGRLEPLDTPPEDTVTA